MRPISRRLRIWLISLALVVTAGLAACNSAPAATPTPPPPPSTAPASVPASTPAPAASAVIDLVAQNLSFNMSTITVPAGAAVTVNFSNKDSVNHNFAVYQNLPGSQVNPVFVGPTIAPGNTVYKFTAPAAAGNYFFECDVHPQNMNGTFIVTIP